MACGDFCVNCAIRKASIGRPHGLLHLMHSRVHHLLAETQHTVSVRKTAAMMEVVKLVR